MAITRLTQNQIKGTNTSGSGYVTIHTDQTASLDLNRPSAGVHLAANAIGETVQALHVSKVICSANGCGFDLFRGANLIGSFTGVNTTDYQEENVRLEAGGDAQANLVITKVGVGNGTVTVKLHKVSGEPS